MKFDPRLLRLARSSRFALALTILFGFAGGILTVLQARLFSQVIGQVFLRGQGISGVAGMLGTLLGLILLRSGFLWGGEISANAVALGVKTRLRTRLFEKFLISGPAWVKGERTGELVTLAVEGVEALDAYFSQYLPQVFLAALVPVTFLALIFPLDPLSAVILLVTAPLIPIFMILVGSLAEALTRQQWQTLSRLSAYFLDALQGLTTLKIYGRSRAQAQGIEGAGNSYREITMGVLRVTFLSALALELIATLSTAVVAVEIGLRLLYGRLSFEQAFFVLLLAPEFYLPLRSLGARFHAGMAGVSAAGRIFEALEKTEGERQRTKDVGRKMKDEGRRTKGTTDDGRQSTDDSKEHSSFVFRPSSDFVASIRFEDVHYTYPDGRSALNGVSFELLPGQRTALVGPSGAGKSTAAGLLLRFAEPSAGQIWVNGRDLKDIPAETWREGVAWVPQRPYLFNDTIEANIHLARPDASLEEVIEAARKASLHEFIERLPEGYATLIGERGARLSGGQAQRIALARAFLKDAPMLIMDEATANLDPELEDEIQASIARLVVSRTVLTIAHRMNTVLRADQVLVLDQGRLVQTGTHAELAGSKGMYRELVKVYRGDFSPNHERWQSAPFPASELSLTPGPLPPSYPAPTFPYSPIPLPPSSSLSTLSRLRKLAAPYKILIALSTLLGFATIGSGIGLMAASAYIIARAALQPSIAELQVAIVGVRFFGIARGVFRYLERYTTHQVTFHLLTRLRTWFYTALEPLAPARLLGHKAGDLLSRAIGDIASLENFYVRAVASPFTAALVAVVVAGWMALYSLPLASSLLILLMLAGAGVPLLTQRISREAGRRVLWERGALSAAWVDGTQGLPDLLAFGQGARQLEKVETIQRSLTRSQRRIALVGGLNDAFATLLAGLGMWTTAVLAIPLVRSGRIEGVLLPVLALAALASFETVQPLPAALQYLEGNLIAARRLFELVDTDPEVRDPPAPLPLPDWRKEGVSENPGEIKAATRRPHPFDLEIKHLSFGYPERLSPHRPNPYPDEPTLFPYPPTPERRCANGVRPSPLPCLPALPLRRPPALHDLTLSLPFGKRLAIVGPSGSGKSTLANLLLRFWEYQEGEILLGGKEIRQFSQDEVRKNLAVVSQEPYLFNATVRENLLLAHPKASEEELIRAAQRAQIHEFILALPQGYDTWIGEGGLRLSGGERQRLALARALLKDAPVLILDEPTANLDALTEREVLRALLAMESRTILLITHRLAGLEAMDEILVLRHNRIIEQGSHAGLLDSSGYYRRMWALQNQVFENLMGTAASIPQHPPLLSTFHE